MRGGLKSVHSRWSNHFAYVLAATGAAVGLGNIWKFPYIMGEHGGGAFVLVYLLCIAVIGIPVMMAEVSIGKCGRQSPAYAVKKLAEQSDASWGWRSIGWMGLVTGYLILSFYAVIAGWALAYVFYGISGEFINDRESISSLFSNLNRSPLPLLGWSSVIILTTVIVVGNGLKHGLERAVVYIMPAMFLLLVIMAIYAARNGDFSQTLSFMFSPNFSSLTVNGVVVALGHAFFTLSLASGVMMMYGAYLPEETSITQTSLWIAAADTLVAIIAGLAIYPIVFAQGMAPGQGPGLIFVTLPLSFAQMPFGGFFGTLFFIMLVFAAFTSAIALIEASVAYLIERATFKRWPAAAISGFGIWILSLGTVMSFTGFEVTNFKFAVFGEQIEASFFQMIDYLTANLLMPIGGVLIALFVGWAVKPSLLKQEFQRDMLIYPLWRFLLRYLSPVAILLVFLTLIGVINV